MVSGTKHLTAVLVLCSMTYSSTALAEKPDYARCKALGDESTKTFESRLSEGTKSGKISKTEEDSLRQGHKMVTDAIGWMNKDTQSSLGRGYWCERLIVNATRENARFIYYGNSDKYSKASVLNIREIDKAIHDFAERISKSKVGNYTKAKAVMAWAKVEQQRYDAVANFEVTDAEKEAILQKVKGLHAVLDKPVD